MRLIDADWVLDHLKSYEPSDEEWIVTGGTALRLIHNAVDNAPTVDAVVVTRCKGCAYGDPTWAGYVCNCNEYAALESTLYHDENFFCAYGEPKDG